MVNTPNTALSLVRRVDTNICVVWVDPELATPQEVLTRLEARTEDSNTSVKGYRDLDFFLVCSDISSMCHNLAVCYKEPFLHLSNS